MGEHMTNFEIALSVAEVGTLWALVRLYRKQLIIRHLFIRSSDWYANKIDEMTESASWTIIEQAQEAAKRNGLTLTDDDARGYIPIAILDARKEWEEQTDELQTTLKLNGLSPLGVFDLDSLIWNPGLAGFKQPLSH